MAIVDLFGHSLPLIGAPFGDHTYATSSNGHTWPCWGRGNGGQVICQASGDDLVADCLSQPNSQAGIFYAVTGVCHQTANRILDPAGILVSAASGYRASVFFYGTYGRGAWPQRRVCASAGGTMPPSGGSRSRRQPLSRGASRGPQADPPRDDMSVATEKFTRAIQEIYATLPNDLSDQESQHGELKLARAELAAMFDSFLGPRYDKEKRRFVVDVQAQVRLMQRALTVALGSNQIPKESFLQTLLFFQRESLETIHRVLGPEDFRKLFGASLAEVAGPVDPRLLQYIGR